MFKCILNPVLPQVMSFIAYVIRAQSPLVQPFAAEIPQVIIRILKDIPPESSLSRRELVVALRHILGTEYRSLFIPFLNDLLTIRIFLGTGITSFESLRHLVYSTHADLIQNIKPELQGSHIKAVLVNFAELLNDPTSTTATQAMAGKVIYSLVDLVGPNRLETHEAIRLSRWLMESFVRKIEALADFRAYQIRHQADTQEKLSSLNRLKDDGIKYKGKGKEVNAPSTSDAQSRPCTESGRLVQPDASLEEDEDILIERGKILGGICAVLEPPPDQFKGRLR
jgi:transformation/transcription domain-associated protein